MAQILIAYSTTDGHTRQICERLRQVVEPQGHRVTVKLVAETGAADREACDAVVIGASIRYGKHKPEVTEFVERHRALLEAKPNALFSVNVVARKPGKDRPEGNPYLQKFLRRIHWKPQRLDVFAGRIEYPRLRPVDRTMIRFIMWMTKGPTDPTGTFEFTDWNRVEAFGRVIAQMAPASAPTGTAPAPR
jgi:menaquinone-dependent protoporphyrinogen oxidase